MAAACRATPWPPSASRTRGRLPAADGAGADPDEGLRHDGPKEGTPTYDHYVAQIVQYMVQEQVVAQSAKDLGVSVTDKQVADQIAQLEKAYGGETKVLTLLKQQGMTMELLKRSIKGQALAQAAIAKVAKGATVERRRAGVLRTRAGSRSRRRPDTFAKAKARRHQADPAERQAAEALDRVAGQRRQGDRRDLRRRLRRGGSATTT